MALTREPEKPESENFQCALPVAWYDVGKHSWNAPASNG